jgi:citrate synthase
MSLVLCLHVLHNLFKLHGTGYRFVLFLQGIRFRGFSLPECQAKLPAAKEGGEPLPEGFLWLLLTGEVPTKEQVDTVTADLRSRSKVPGHVFDVINAFPVTAHPMTQLTAGVMALQTESEFAKAYETGIHKTKYWEPIYEDAMNLIARLPEVAAFIYSRTYKGGVLHEADPNVDYAANFAQMLGFQDELMHELMRLYISIHSDHEGGNVSAHTVHLVSAVFLSFSLAL